MSLPHATQEALLSLYRGEVSAVQAYDRALTKFAGQPEEPTLREIHEQHVEAVRLLDGELEKHGIKTPESSGAWGVVANAVHTLTSLVNDEVPLKVLQRGEEIGITDYAKAIASAGFEPAFVQQLQAGHARCQRHCAQIQHLRDIIDTQPTRPMM